MKKLPNIFKPNIDRKINNNEKTYYSYLETKVQNDTINSNERHSFRISKLNNNNYIFNTKVLIKTKNNNLETTIVSKMGNNIITIDGKIIPVRDIVSIDEI